MGRTKAKNIKVVETFNEERKQRIEKYINNTESGKRFLKQRAQQTWQNFIEGLKEHPMKIDSDELYNKIQLAQFKQTYGTEIYRYCTDRQTIIENPFGSKLKDWHFDLLLDGFQRATDINDVEQLKDFFAGNRPVTLKSARLFAYSMDKLVSLELVEDWQSICERHSLALKKSGKVHSAKEFAATLSYSKGYAKQPPRGHETIDKALSIIQKSM